jgi:shikimate dehydrogenase
MHAFLLEKTGLKGSYTPWPTTAEDLEKTLKHCHQEGVWGLNLTIPHKTSVLTFLEELTPDARIIGAVNTLTRTDTGWCGHNTDVSGFWRGVPDRWKESLNDQHVVILGNGGAARAILSCFLKHPPKTLTLICRNTDKGQKLLEDFNKTPSQCLPWETASFEALLPKTHWLIQTTPLGMAGGGNETAMPFDTELFKTVHTDLKVSDLVYRPSQTPLLKASDFKGLETQNGLPMLVYQGIEAFERWTGQSISENTAQTLLEEILPAHIPV